MTFRLRQVLSVFLFVLFSLESVAASATTGAGKNMSLKQVSSTIAIQPLLALLVEESEERDNKDDGDMETYTSHVGLPFGFGQLPDAVGKNYKDTAALRGSVSSALYKFFCSLLL